MGYGEQEIEHDVQEKGLTAPRITPDAIDAKIAGEQYHRFPGTTMTVCCLVTSNGFAVIGQAAAASPENFDAEIGRKVARADARDKLWLLEGYLLRERLSTPESIAEQQGTQTVDGHPASQQVRRNIAAVHRR
jgi:Phage protein (N4 Gp49/phage Sf6 gene 66) family